MNQLPVYQIATGNKSLDTWVLFLQAHRAVDRVRTRQVQRLGMEPGQSSVLFVLVNKGGASTSKELSEILGREVQTITGFINRMERSGLVKRVKEAPDRRFTKIVITDKGRHACRLLLRPNAAADIFALLKEEDRACLLRCLVLIRREALRLIHGEVEMLEIHARMDSGSRRLSRKSTRAP